MRRLGKACTDPALFAQMIISQGLARHPIKHGRGEDFPLPAGFSGPGVLLCLVSPRR